MTEQLLAYLLDDLNANQRREVEARLADNPQWQAEFARLRDCLQGCGGDCDDVPTDVSANAAPPAEQPAPPVDLAQRTCSLVESGVHELPPPDASDGAACGRRGWRMVDLTVAAGVFLAMGSLMLPALVESRDATRRATCENKLRELGFHFVRYAENNNRQLPPLRPGQNAGMYAVYLADQCGVSRQRMAELVTCPATRLADDVADGRVRLWIPARHELTAARGPGLIALRQTMGGSYAYAFGFFNRHGQLQQMRFVASSNLPVLADAPDATADGFRSMHHGQPGENVLYQDGSVRFVVGNQAPGGDDLFRNRAGLHAAGVARDDVVLGRSGYEPYGTIFPMGE